MIFLFDDEAYSVSKLYRMVKEQCIEVPYFDVADRLKNDHVVAALREAHWRNPYDSPGLTLRMQEHMRQEGDGFIDANRQYFATDLKQLTLSVLDKHGMKASGYEYDAVYEVLASFLADCGPSTFILRDEEGFATHGCADTLALQYCQIFDQQNQRTHPINETSRFDYLHPM